jgi:enoyl-CoA hydratase/carnithine racemase
MTPKLTVSGRRADIVLDAPERRNALGPEDVRALAAALDEIERNPQIDVAVLSATGDTFCAGYDLRALRADVSSSDAGAAQRSFARVVDALENLRVPTFCVLRGGAYGGGTDLALACDVRLGTPHASLSVPAARFGLQFYYGGLRRYVERLGVDAAKRIFLLAETFEAPELLRMGFLHEIVSADEIVAKTNRLADRLLGNVADATGGLKRSLNAIARGAGRVETIDDAFATSLRNPETIERLTGRSPLA